MSTLLHDIQLVRSFRKTIRDPKIPGTVLKAMENIHQCMKNGTDQNGWKKVEWRGQPSSKGGSFFGNRDTGDAASANASSTTSSAPYQYQNRSMNATKGNAPSLRQSPLHHLNDARESRNTTPKAAETEASDNRRTPSWPTDGYRPQKYVSKFKKTSENVEDTILNTILLGKLNKFSQPNYNEIKEFITHIIDSGQNSMITCFMKLVFEKAASEEVFCPLYAKLLSELSASYPVLLTEMATLYDQYMEIFEEVADGTDENYNELCKRNVEKKYRRGYSQFLAELIKHNVIDTEMFMKIITKIIQQVEANLLITSSIKLNEEFADCFIKIMKAITTTTRRHKHEVEHAIRATLKEETAQRIHPWTVKNAEYVGISNKARFGFLSIYEDIQKW